MISRDSVGLAIHIETTGRHLIEDATGKSTDINTLKKVHSFAMPDLIWIMIGKSIDGILKNVK